MRVTGIIRGLQEVAVYMNAIGPQTAQPQWKAFLNTIRPPKLETGPFFHWVANRKTLFGKKVPSVDLDQAKNLRSWIHRDLEFLRADTSPNRPFDDLRDRLNNLQLKMAWRCEPMALKARPHDPSQAIFNMRWGDGTVERWVAQSWSVTKTLTDHFYAILGKALETGALSRLKVCRECQKYMVVDDHKRQFCRTKCHDDYHNRETHAENRKHRKDRAILMAKKLAEAGKSSDVIQEQTGLPRRTVEQILAGDLSPNSQQRPKTVPRPKRLAVGLDPTFVPVPLTREQLETIIAEEAHRDKVYMQGIRAARKPNKQKPARKSK
jgi:hypothetical protein